MKKFLMPVEIGAPYRTPDGKYRCYDGRQWHYCDRRGNIIDRKTKRRK